MMPVDGNEKRPLLSTTNAEENAVNIATGYGSVCVTSNKSLSSDSCARIQGVNTCGEVENEISKTETPLVGFFSLFRFCSACEKAVIILAAIVAAVSGIGSPALIVVYGNIVDHLVHFGRETLAENCTSNYTDLCSHIREELADGTAIQCMWASLLGVFCIISCYSSVTLFHFIATNQAFKIRCKFMAAVLKQEIGWYDTHNTGDFASKITGDLSIIQDGIGDKVALCIRCISTCVLSIACGIYYGWKLGLVTVSFAPIPLCIISILSKKQASIAREEIQSYSIAGAVAEEVLSAIRTVVAFGGERKEIERYEVSLVPAMKKGIKRGLITAIGNALSNSSIFFFYAIGLGYGVHLLLEDWGRENPTYTPGVIVNVFMNICLAAIFFGHTPYFFEAFGLARGAASKIFDIIDRKPLIDSSSDSGQKPSSLNGKISLEAVHFTYPARPNVPVLQGLNLIVDPGKTVALVGPSGCGKSTIIQLILRFYDVNSGTVALDGYKVEDLNIGWLRDNISLVGQEPVLFSTTIEANIMYGKPGASLEDVKKAAKLANIHEFIDSLPLKYKTLVGEHGTQLSGGQKQRVAIARAIIKNPKILLLDEATSALDTESETIVQAALEEASLGRTTLVVAHRLSTIKNADKIVVLANGTVQEVGTHNELMEKHGLYYDLVLAQTAEEESKEGLDCASEDIMLSKKQRSPSFEGNTSVEDLSDNLDLKSGIAVGKKENEEKSHSSIIRLLQLCTREWPYVVIGTISAVLIGAYLVSLGVLFGDSMGVLKEDKSVIEAKYGFFCILFVVMAVVCFIFNFLQVFMFAIAGEKLTCRLRKMVFARIITQDIAFFDHEKNSVGSLCSRLSADASAVQGAAGSRISTLIQCFSAVAAAVAISFWYSYKIALVTLPFIPITTLAFYFEHRVTGGQMDDERLASEEATKIAVEAIGSIRTVASLHQEAAICTQFRISLYGPHRKSQIKSHVRGFMYSLGQSLHPFYYAAAFYFGTRLVADGELSYADFLKVMDGVFLCVSVVGQSIAFAPEYQKGKMAAVRIFKLLDLKSKIDAFSERGRFLKNIKGNISFANVHFNYPSRPHLKILDGLNLEIESGKTVALVGSSGCGKSTCVQLIERLYDANSGKVMVDDTNVEEMNVANLRSHISVVSQEPVLFSCSIAKNIAYGDNSRIPDHNEVISAARQANIHNFITSLPEGYDTPVGEKGTHLSGGQKQRVAIARALLRNPKILLLDEATSALDAESEKVVQEALEEARQGRTCLIIAHRLSTIQNADTIVVIHNGKVAEKGTHQELLRIKGHYYNLQRIQDNPN